MDTARDFDLLGESVPQVRVSAHTLVLLGIFQLHIYPDSLLPSSKYFSCSGTWSGGSQAFDCLPDGSGDSQSAPWSEVRQELIGMRVLEVRHQAVFFLDDGALA